MQDFVKSDVGGDSALSLWNSEELVTAWGETSDLVNMSSTTEMHLVLRVPLGEELSHGTVIVDRIGGMSPRPD